MTPQLYLMTPIDPDPSQFARQAMRVLSGPDVAVLLVRRGGLDDAAYAGLAERLVQIGQAAGAAVLLEDALDLVQRVGADGVHISHGGVAAIRAASAALKPKDIVGAGAIRSRHDAMSFGELDVDYVFFGPPDGAAGPQARELAQWWAETFEVPAVLSDPAFEVEHLPTITSEFIALSDSIWNRDDPAAALADFARALGEPA